MEKIETRVSLIPRMQHIDAIVDPRYARWKPIFDIVMALLFLPLVAPLFLVSVIAIKLCSPGPVFYHQQRIGKDGKPFMMLKFRSMQNGNSSHVHRQFMQRMIRENLRPEDVGLKVMKLKDDSRITRPGK